MTFSEGNTGKTIPRCRLGPTNSCLWPYISRLKAKQVAGGKIKSVAPEEVPYSTEEFNDFANSCRQKSGECVRAWISRVRGNGAMNITPGQGVY